MTPPIRIRPDGTKYPLRGGSGNGTTAAIAVGTALTLWAASGGVVGPAVSGPAMSAAESAVVRNIQTNLSKARQDVRRGKPERAWQRLRLRQGTEKIHEAVARRCLPAKSQGRESRPRSRCLSMGDPGQSRYCTL